MTSPMRITDISKDGYRLFRQRMGIWYWVFISVAIAIDVSIAGVVILLVMSSSLSSDRIGDALEGLIFIFLFPWILLAAIHGGITAHIRPNFWKQFAAEKGWNYSRTAELSQERGLMFREGHSRQAVHEITGMFAGLPIRFFDYAFSKGQGKQRQTYLFSVFEFRLPGSFPHVYLNYDDGYDIKPGKELHLPESLRTKFHLYVADQYEIEALQMFTPDVLALIEDLEWKYDLELVDQELIVYRRGNVNTRGALEMEFAKAAALVAKLRPTLERMRFEKIGSNDPLLNR